MQKVLPTTERVILSTKDHEYWGDTGKTKKGFNIRINWNHVYPVIERWILPHEYAHCRVWGRLQAESEAHDGHFYLEIGIVEKAAGIVAEYEE